MDTSKRILQNEFDTLKLNDIRLNIIREIYQIVLTNVENSIVNDKSIIITRVGSQFKDIIRSHSLNKQDMYNKKEYRTISFKWIRTL